MQLSSDFIGPLPTGTEFRLRISTHPEGFPNVIWQFIPTSGNTVAIFVGDRFTTTSQNGGEVVAEGAQVHVIAELVTDAQVVIDSGATNATWDPVTQMWQHINENTGGTTGGGFTETDRQLVVATERRTQMLGEPNDLVVDTPSGPLPFTLGQLFSRKNLETLVLSEVTSGPTCDPVRFTFSEWYSGVVVRVTTIAPDLHPKTPDDDWYFPDLAVLRVFRGVDLKFRRGIHTPTFMTDERWEWNWNIRDVFAMLGGPPATTVAVDWRAGCCGQVFLLRFP